MDESDDGKAPLTMRELLLTSELLDLTPPEYDCVMFVSNLMAHCEYQRCAHILRKVLTNSKVRRPPPRT